MPIKRYVEEGVVFKPEALSAMNKALTDTVETLGFGSDAIKRQVVAKFIIRLAQEDGSLDAMTLRDRAVAALGGVAYLDLAAAIPAPSNSPQIAGATAE
jgi:hypothetical protein